MLIIFDYKTLEFLFKCEEYKLLDSYTKVFITPNLFNYYNKVRNSIFSPTIPVYPFSKTNKHSQNELFSLLSNDKNIFIGADSKYLIKQAKSIGLKIHTSLDIIENAIRNKLLTNKNDISKLYHLIDHFLDDK